MPFRSDPADCARHIPRAVDRIGTRAVRVAQAVKITRFLPFLLPGILVIALTVTNEAQAAPTYQAFSGIAAAANGNADPTVTLPAHAQNDILLLATIVRSGTATVATPAGWTQIGSPTVRAGTATYQFFWIRAGATAVPNPLIDRTGTTGDVYAAVVVYRNATSIGDPWEVKGTVTTGTTDPSVIAGITTLTNDSLVVVAVAGEDNNNGAITTTGTNPAAYTEHYVESAVGADGVITFSEAARTTAGATGNVSVNWDNAVPVGFGGIVLALKPQGTVLGNGTDPANAAIGPGGAATMAGAFTFKTGTGTDTITDVTVGLGTGAAGGLSLVEITNDAGTTVYGSVTNPATDTPTIALSTNTLTATTTQTQYKIRVTPRSHASMPVPPGATYTVTAKINSWTGSGTQEGSDTAGTTVTIDNLSPGEVTGASGVVGSGQVALSWTNPADADFSNVLVLRNTVAVADTPVEGATYAVGNTIGTSVVRYILNGTSFTDTGLTNGTDYHYKIFTRDTNGNYSPGSVPSGSPFRPGPYCYAVASANWNVASTWANTTPGGTPGTCGGAGGVPDASVTAFIGETATAYNVTIPAGYAAQAGNLTIGSNTNNAKSLTLAAATASLAVGGNLTINKPASNTTTNALNVNAGTVTVGGDVTFGGTTGTASRVARINVTTGTLTIGGDLVFVAGVDANNYLDLSGGAATVNLAGAFTATVGTLVEGTSSTFNYNGTAAQTVRLNLGNIDYYNLHINNTSASGATLNANVTTANVFGNLRVQSGTLNDGGFTLAGGAGDTFEVANGATFVYTTNTWVSGFTRTLGATSTVNYARNDGNNQNVANENYGHLTLSGSGTKILPAGTLNVAGNLSMSGTAALNHNNGTVNMNGSAAQTISLNATNSNLNNLTISNTGTGVTASGNVGLQGNFTNNGVFNAGTSTFTFNSGGNDQTITGATTFYNITLNNTNGTGTELTLNSDTTVNGTFSFVTGNVVTGANTLVIGNTTSCGVSGAGAGVGYVVGKLRKNFTASLLDCTFEVGDNTLYAPVRVVFDSVTVSGTVTASTTSGDHPNIATSSINSAQSVNRYWTLTQGGALAFGSYIARFSYNDPADLDAGVTPADFMAQRFESGAWFNTNPSSTIPPSSTEYVIEGETGFGDFAVGESTITGFLQEREFIYQREVYY